MTKKMYVCFYDYHGLAATYQCKDEEQPRLIRLSFNGDSNVDGLHECCGDKCCRQLATDLLTSLHFWLWLVTIIITIIAFLSFSLYYSLKWSKKRGQIENLNPFLIAQLTTTGKRFMNMNNMLLIALVLR